MDQSILDQLFQAIYYQTKRVSILDRCRLPTNTVWNKAHDEKQIFDLLVHEYKEYYLAHITTLEQQILMDSQKQEAALWFTDYTIKEREKILLEHLVVLRQRLQSITIDNVCCTDLSVPTILHPYSTYLLKPSLLTCQQVIN